VVLWLAGLIAVGIMMAWARNAIRPPEALSRASMPELKIGCA